MRHMILGSIHLAVRYWKAGQILKWSFERQMRYDNNIILFQKNQVVIDSLETSQHTCNPRQKEDFKTTSRISTTLLALKRCPQEIPWSFSIFSAHAHVE